MADMERPSVGGDDDDDELQLKMRQLMHHFPDQHRFKHNLLSPLITMALQHYGASMSPTDEAHLKCTRELLQGEVEPTVATQQSRQERAADPQNLIGFRKAMADAAFGDQFGATGKLKKGKRRMSNAQDQPAQKNKKKQRYSAPDLIDWARVDDDIPDPPRRHSAPSNNGEPSRGGDFWRPIPADYPPCPFPPTTQARPVAPVRPLFPARASVQPVSQPIQQPHDQVQPKRKKPKKQTKRQKKIKQKQTKQKQTKQKQPTHGHNQDHPIEILSSDEDDGLIVLVGAPSKASRTLRSGKVRQI